MPLDDRAPGRVAQTRLHLGGVDDIGEEDGGQDGIQSDGRPLDAGEPANLLVHRVDRARRPWLAGDLAQNGTRYQADGVLRFSNQALSFGVRQDQRWSGDRW